MPKLILTLDDAMLGEYPLEKKYVTIGRRPTNDIHIDNLAVSGDHARVITIDGHSMLEDLGSTNGSIVNGASVDKQSLQHGDVISISKYQLKFIDDHASVNARTPTDFENTIMMQPLPGTDLAKETGKTAAPPEIEAPTTSHEAPALAPASVQILNGPAKGKELPLTKTLTTLGKSGEQVAVITRRPHGYFITHVEGEQYPLLNGDSIGVQAHQLNDHDVIELAGVKMEFYLSEN